MIPQDYILIKKSDYDALLVVSSQLRRLLDLGERSDTDIVYEVIRKSGLKGISIADLIKKTQFLSLDGRIDILKFLIKENSITYDVKSDTIYKAVSVDEKA